MILHKLCTIYLLAFTIGCNAARLGHRSLEEDDISNLRYVAFGTSVTYGSGVDLEKETYMKLLSPTSTNLAIRASDPSYPSVCTQSMVGDSIYDVIIVEYERRYNMGLADLVRRLRERFPDATIIVTNVWTFYNIDVKDERTGVKINFASWIRRSGFEKNSIEAWAYVRDVINNDENISFEFVENSVISDQTVYINGIVNKYDLKLFSWPKDGDIKFIILRYLPLYSWDFVHWSAEGHKHAAISIQKILRSEKKIPSDRLGTWGAGDVCNNWVYNGKIEDIKSLVATNGKMVQFDNKHGAKFALEFPTLSSDGNNNDKGFITINNPFNVPRELSLTYMTTGPAPSIYPKTKLYFESQESTNAVEIDPTDTFYNYPVHVQFSKVIGKINPGTSKIIIEPLEVKEKPFRLVAFSITEESGKISSMYAKPIV